MVALGPFVDSDTGGDKAVDEGPHGGATDDAEFDSGGEGALYPPQNESLTCITICLCINC